MVVKENQKLTRAFTELDARYMKRCFDPQTRKLAAKFLIDCYQEWKHVGSASELDERALKYFWLGAELTDYFNILNDYLEEAEGAASNGDGQVEELKAGTVYKWLISTSQKLLGDLLSQIERPEAIKEESRNLVNHRIRFCSAVTINERYRQSDYDYYLKYLPRFITYMEAQLERHTEQRDKEIENCNRYAKAEIIRKVKERIINIENEMTAYEDTLSYLYFLCAKSTRQKLLFRESIDDALRATDYLLSSAVTLTENEDFDRTVGDVRLAHFRLRRVGVTDSLRAWTYLAWGRISSADAVSRRAQLLINKEDGLNFYLALSIRGIVKRIKAGRKDKKQLAEAIVLMKKSYKFFNDFPFPRYAIRSLFELALAHVLNDEISKATKLFLNLSARLRAHDRGPFRNLLTIARWKIQQHLILSHIAREDKTGENVELLAKAGWLRQPTSHKRRDLLEIAVEEANNGLALARERKVCRGELEALIYVGEGELALADELGKHTRASADGQSSATREAYERARFAFTEAAELSFPRGAFEHLREVVFPRQLGAADCNIDQLALCKLYLAKISIACGDGEQADLNLTYYRSLLPLEHGRVAELAAEVSKEFEDMNRVIIVRYKEGDDYKQIKENYNVALANKMKGEGRSVTEIAQMLHVSRGTIHNLITKAKEVQSDDGLPD